MRAAPGHSMIRENLPSKVEKLPDGAVITAWLGRDAAFAVSETV